jgi:uncharacterized membrane protein YdbT with pleckstrin-like domain
LFTIGVFVVPLIVWTYLYFQVFTFAAEIFWVATIVWGLMAVFFIVYNYLDWYLDIYLVTSQRIIDITQNGLFHRQVGESPLDNVQDVIYEIKGIIPTLFNYGNVKIHTAGPSGDIVFEQVKDPQGVQRYLLQQVEAYKDANTEKVATPEDLLHMMLSYEREKLLKQGGAPKSAESAGLPASAEQYVEQNNGES